MSLASDMHTCRVLMAKRMSGKSFMILFLYVEYSDQSDSVNCTLIVTCRL